MENILREKSYAFALRVVGLSKFLHETRHEYVLSRKILDSGTNIGLFIEEGRQGDSRDDFRAKYSLANKEAFKTNFLIRLLRDKGYLSREEGDSILRDCEELQKMLISTLKSTKPEHR